MDSLQSQNHFLSVIQNFFGLFKTLLGYKQPIQRKWGQISFSVGEFQVICTGGDYELRVDLSLTFGKHQLNVSPFLCDMKSITVWVQM